MNLIRSHSQKTKFIFITILLLGIATTPVIALASQSQNVYQTVQQLTATTTEVTITPTPNDIEISQLVEQLAQIEQDLQTSKLQLDQAQRELQQVEQQKSALEQENVVLKQQIQQLAELMLQSSQDQLSAQDSSWQWRTSLAGVGLVVSVISLISLFARRKQEEETKEKVEKAEQSVQSQPEKARPAWDLARVTLDAYFNRNLNQISYIFWFSVFVMVLGFGVIIWGAFQAIRLPIIIGPASITIGAGVITEFIGATFILIYRSTLNQALNYAKSLERINSVGMAMQILDTIPDEAKTDSLKSKTKAALVELLLKQPQEINHLTQGNPKS